MDLYSFKNGDGHVTPVLYYNRDEVPWWYFDFYNSNLDAACGNAGLDSTSNTCHALNQSFIANSVLNGSLAIAILFTVCSAILIIFMFWKKHFRFTVSTKRNG